MELLQLQYFRTIARYESITKAAAYHNVPQPSMSQSLARLERELGDVKLFDRKNNRIFLNDNGKVFLNHVDNALRELDYGVNALASQSNDICGDISILVLENRRFIINCELEFAKLYPTVNFSVSHDYFSGHAHTYSLCVNSQDNYMQMHDGVPLIKERIVLAVHKNHPLSTREAVALDELKKEKFITTPVQSSLYNLTIDNCRNSGFEPNIPFICDEIYF